MTASSDDRILIIDDHVANVRLLAQMLEVEGYSSVTCVTDARQALPVFVEERPDLVLLDLHMPYLSGTEVLTRIRALIPAEEYLPVLVLTADDAPQTKLEALDLGATDFLTKPFDHAEAVLRIRHLLDARALHVRLEERVAERTRELEESRLEVLTRLALAAEFRDDATHAHTQRVGRNAAALAVEIGVARAEATIIGQAAPLHDVGKLGVPDAVLLKPGRLTPEEFEEMKAHAEIGGRLLSGSRSEVLRLGEQIARTHHERFDGNGYPKGLAGDDIPLAGRLVAVVDVFDALTSARPYKRAWTREEAAAEIEHLAGRSFDPDMVAAFLRLLGRGDVETGLTV